MKTVRWIAGIILFAATTVQAQEPPKPGPEHEVLKKMVGTWDCTMDMGGMKSKATSTYKMDLGDLWLSSTFEGSFGPGKFSGRGFDTYDAASKKYRGVWFDNMSTHPMVMEGSYDKATKTMTMIGDAPGMDGKLAKHKIVTAMPDENTMNFAMYVGDGKDPAFTIVYKRKK